MMRKKGEIDMKKTSLQIAQEIKQTADDLGWQLAVRNGSILTITKKLARCNMEEFTKADMEYYSILGKLPTTSPGSMWGTDGGGVGGMSALNSGCFEQIIKYSIYDEKTRRDINVDFAMEKSRMA
jgi:hypothetical protein